MFTTAYQPQAVEKNIYNLWNKSGFFNPDKLKKTTAKKFVVYMPLPNVTGTLHIGHVLNNTLQDILVRYYRLRGFKSLWLPGIDHAGIATQYMVEKELKKQNLTRFQLGREKFVERIWKWKNKYSDAILEQLKQLGCSADWSRLRFTMDKNYSRDVLNAFIYFFKKGLIYRGLRTVNWCCRCATTLSDLELEYEEEKTKLWYIKYPLVKNPKSLPCRQAGEIRNPKQIQNSKFKIQNFIVVATTRPETMLGDTAVAVNPKDKRYKDLIGKTVVLPIQNREIPIKADLIIDPTFGTGAVKVTPAHDIADFEISQRHNLPMIQVIDKKGIMNQNAGRYSGFKTKEAREKIIEELKNLSLLDKEEDYVHRIAKCYRCGNIIESIPSKQWFLKMDKIAGLAQDAVRTSRVKITPKNFEKIYFSWLDNIRDWAISRQIWWGHQLPVFFCRKKQEEIRNSKSEILNSKNGNDFIVSLTKPKNCPFCKSCKMEQSADVLDTWFSSALWPFAGLSKSDLKKYYPGDVVITARDILNLWISRMIFFGLEFQKTPPFKNVFINGTILDKKGRRMSKSLGTGVDPLSYIRQYGADVLRFGVVWQATGQDIRWDEAALTAGKKFCNKIWNASRFVLMNKLQRINTDFSGLTRIKNLTAADKKILKELVAVKKKVEIHLQKFEFSKALHQIYHFFWHNFCDIYIEESKKQLTTDDLQLTTKKILFYILVESLKILHPFMPFITEAVYQKAPDFKNKSKILMIKKW